MPDRRSFLAAGSLGLATLAFRARPTTLLPSRPNLLLILADDLGYGDLSVYGRPDYRTPELDRFASDGVRFTDAYSAASTCTPTRTGLMTGRWPARYPAGLQGPMGWVNTKDGLAPDEPTLASLLKRAGYRTSLVGKWHLGYLPDFGPLRHGFDEFFGILSGGVHYFSHKGADDRLDLWEGTASVERVGYLTNLLTDRAIDVIRRRQREPFYLSLHYTAPHWPWEGPDHEGESSRWKTMTDGGSLEIFASMVRSLDRNVGRLLAALKRAGLERDTLVLFTSDNGGERYSYNWPFWDEKASLWEGGIRVPAMLRWPGVIPAGRTTGQVASSIDWTATFLAAAGARADAERPLDGIDLLPSARGGAAEIERTLHWRQPVIYTRQPPQWAVRRGKWKLLRIGAKDRLFDLEIDRRERTDLTQYEPATLAEMTGILERWDAAMTPMPPQTPG